MTNRTPSPQEAPAQNRKHPVARSEDIGLGIARRALYIDRRPYRDADPNEH